MSLFGPCREEVCHRLCLSLEGSWFSDGKVITTLFLEFWPNSKRDDSNSCKIGRQATRATLRTTGSRCFSSSLPGKRAS